jgi:cytochrome c oxidase subunit II
LQPLLASFLTPDSPASPNADEMQAIYLVMLVLAIAIGVAINAALVVAAIRFRARRGAAPTRRTAGRRTVPRLTAGLIALALAVFIVGVVYTESARKADPSGPEGLQAAAARTAQVAIEPPPPADGAAPLEVNAIGQQWVWRYEYPDGTFSYYEMVVPVDTTVVLQLDSTDVVHRWWVPALGGKFDAVPGRANETWFQADEEGVYEGQSAAFSGPAYPTMRARVRVVSVQEYEAWLEQQASDIQEAQEAVQQQVTEAAEQTQPEQEGGATGGAETEPSEGSAPGGEAP